MIGTKLIVIGMILDRIKKMTKVQNQLPDLLNIQNNSKALTPLTVQDDSPCAHYLSVDHVKLDCLVVIFQGLESTSRVKPLIWT